MLPADDLWKEKEKERKRDHGSRRQSASEDWTQLAATGAKPVKTQGRRHCLDLDEFEEITIHPRKRRRINHGGTEARRRKDFTMGIRGGGESPDG